MVYISVKEASQKWGLSERRVRLLCSEGRVDGVVRSSWAWNIPSTASKPGDGRKIRHIKNFDLRIGGINFETLDNIRNNLSQSKLKDEAYLKYFDNSVNRYLCAFFEDEKISEDQVIQVLEEGKVENLSLSKHILIKNAKTIIIGFMKETGFASIKSNGSKANPFFNEKKLMTLNERLVEGIDDYYESKYRDVEIPFSGAWSQDNRKYKVFLQMETLMVQYENEWALINPMVKAAFMFGEMMRIKPFEKHSLLFSSIIFAGNLLEGGYPLAILSSNMFNELKADLSLTLKRGNYNKILRLFENSIVREYKIIKEI